jgi:hypothetical protein
VGQGVGAEEQHADESERHKSKKQQQERTQQKKQEYHHRHHHSKASLAQSLAPSSNNTNNTNDTKGSSAKDKDGHKAPHDRVSSISDISRQVRSSPFSFLACLHIFPALPSFPFFTCFSHRSKIFCCCV